ncbi:MAG: hypothetical protein J6R99_01785 [Alphaproteobacteria bacterium]|nr:hypothetical protein [Alphaproteobacteria bacterium]
MWSNDTNKLAEIAFNKKLFREQKDTAFQDKYGVVYIAACLVKENDYTDGDIAVLIKREHKPNEPIYTLTARGMQYNSIYGQEARELNLLKAWLAESVYCWTELPLEFQDKITRPWKQKESQ